MARLSIITPCYNAQRFIGKTIESIGRQTFTDWEHWVVDDGSSDASAEIVMSYAARDPRLHLLKQANGGACNARNNGFKACSKDAEYVLFFDADDEMEPSMLQVIVEHLDRHPEVGLAYSDTWYVDEAGQPLETPAHRRFVPSRFGIREIPYEALETPLASVFGGASLYESGCVMRRSIYAQTNGWDEWIGQGGEGVDLFTQIALLSKVHFIQQKLYKYRQYPTQATRTTIDFDKQKQKVISKWREGKWLNPEQQAEIRKLIWLHENRLEPLFNVIHGTALLSRGQFAKGLGMCFGNITKYCRSLFRPVAVTP